MIIEVAESLQAACAMSPALVRLRPPFGDESAGQARRLHSNANLTGGHPKELVKLMAPTILLTLALPSLVWSHGGGLNAEGCHNNRKTGDYHCHGSGGASQNSRSSTDTAPGFGISPQGVKGSRPAIGQGASFGSCAQARAAGAAPLRRGEQGYGPHLDRDRDGVACE